MVNGDLAQHLRTILFILFSGLSMPDKGGAGADPNVVSHGLFASKSK